jgi:prolipoprotein diacylglyceryltransferase
MDNQDDGAWFAPKHFGIGTGLPIRWQGWALLAGYLAVIALFGYLSQSPNGGMRAVSFAMILGATVWVAVVAARRTRGGWRWRWGKAD